MSLPRRSHRRPGRARQVLAVAVAATALGAGAVAVAQAAAAAPPTTGTGTTSARHWDGPVLPLGLRWQ